MCSFWTLLSWMKTFLSLSFPGQHLLSNPFTNPPGSGSCHVAAGLNRSEWVIGIHKHQITPAPPLLLAQKGSQGRHDSCIKDKWRWIVHQACVITTEHKQKPDAFVWCWVWPLSRCLVNRRQSDTWGWKCSWCTLVSDPLHLLWRSLCHALRRQVAGFYANMEGKQSHARAPLEGLHWDCRSHFITLLLHFCRFKVCQLSFHTAFIFLCIK